MHLGLPWALSGKESTCQSRRHLRGAGGRGTRPQGAGLPPRPVLLGLSPQWGQDGGEGSSGRVRERLNQDPDPGPTTQLAGSLPSAWLGGGGGGTHFSQPSAWLQVPQGQACTQVDTPLSAQPGARPGPTPPDTWGRGGAGPGPTTTSQRCNSSSPRPWTPCSLPGNIGPFGVTPMPLPHPSTWTAASQPPAE